MSGSTQFKHGLLEGLARVERHALQEVERLSKELQQLRGENEQLRQQLAERAACPSGSEVSHDRAEDTETPPLEPHFAKAERRPSIISQLHLTLPGDNEVRRPSRERSRQCSKEVSPSQLLVAERKNCVQHLVKTQAFDNTTMAFIVLNAVWLGVDADTNGKPLLQSPVVYQVVEHVFVVIFVTEFALRSFAIDEIRMALTDKWYVFDMVLVPLMIIDSWVLNLIILATGRSDLSGFGFFSVLRMLRISRIVRMARICRFVPELDTMVSSMMSGVRSVMITSLILLVITYGFAILMRELSESTTWGQELFPNVPSSVYTLLVQSVLPDNGDLLAVMLRDTWSCCILYFVFLVFSAIMLVNMLIALLCDVVGKVSRDELTQRGIDTLSVKLETILSSIDENYDGGVSKAEFERIIENPAAVNLLQDVGVDVDALVDEADFIFQRHKKNLSFEDFKEEVLQFRQSSFATMGTITAMRRFIRLSLEQVASKIVRLEALVRELKDEPRGASRAPELACPEPPPLDAKLPSLPPEPADLAARSATPDCATYGEMLLGVSRLWPGSSRRRCSSVELS